MSKLYPIKFEPIYKDKIWGGHKINSILNKNFAPLPNCGESWEISGIEDNISVVSNGFLKGNTLQEIIEIYMGDIVGENIYLKYGIEFPLLIKFIDANDVLSIQVHPDDKMARKKHNAYGKTEMWYIIQADNNAELISGFNKKMDKKTYLENLNNNTLKNILNVEKVKSGDVFFLPAGRVHAIGSGILLAEIQQTSDITYRIYDWNRKDDNGNERELHTELALEAMDFNLYENYKTTYKAEKNTSSKLIACNYFTTNILEIDKTITKEFHSIDSFKIYMCIDGKLKLTGKDIQPTDLLKGETVLIPAIIDELVLEPIEESKLIEIYIEA
ncbi:MAG: mannose-6-phosphate isomerase [Chlorobi bacterium]|nr:mannose-6-phosphate isomerase [Chlorobiota bacterium]